MKFKQAFVLGLITTALAVPAFAEDTSSDDITGQSYSLSSGSKSTVIPSDKNSVQKKGPQDKLDAKKQGSMTDKLNKKSVSGSTEIVA